MYLTYLTRTLKWRHRMVDKFCELPVITLDEIRDSSCNSYLSTFYRNYIETNDNDNMKYQSKNHIHVQWNKTRAVTPCSTIYVSFFKLKSFSVVRIDMKNFRETMSKRQISINENLYLANINMISSSMPFYKFKTLLQN